MRSSDWSPAAILAVGFALTFMAVGARECRVQVRP